jgi:hypothetical protein
MKLSQIRAQLLDQHAALRDQVGATCAVMDRWMRGEPLREEARACIARLTEALRAHNRQEEALLKDIVKTIDAWGPARVEIMGEEHVKEHDELYAALMNATLGTDARSCALSIVKLLDRLLDHMAHEEKTFLGEDVLSDDDTFVDAFGG